MQGVLIYRWDADRHGGVAGGMADSERTNPILERMLEDGLIEAFEWVHPISGPDAEMLILRGDLPTLLRAGFAPELLMAMNRSMFVREGFHWEVGIADGEFDADHPRWRELLIGVPT